MKSQELSIHSRINHPNMTLVIQLPKHSGVWTGVIVRWTLLLECLHYAFDASISLYALKLTREWRALVPCSNRDFLEQKSLNCLCHKHVKQYIPKSYTNKNSRHDIEATTTLKYLSSGMGLARMLTSLTIRGSKVYVLKMPRPFSGHTYVPEKAKTHIST